MPKASRQADRRFPPHASALDVARVVLQELNRDLRRHARAARGSEDPERTHKLRVSVRRLRTGIRLFGPLLDADRAEPIAEDLRWLFRRLGAVREFDVLFAALAESADAVVRRSEPTIEPELAARRQRAARAARRALSSRRYVRLLRELRQLPRALVAADDAPPRARRWARKRLQKRLSRVLALRAKHAERHEVERHELRKQMKKLRYAVELLGPLFARKRVRAYLAPLIDLQDVLGELNDAVVSRRLLCEAGETRGVGIAELLAPSELPKKTQRKLEKRFRAFEAAAPFWCK